MVKYKYKNNEIVIELESLLYEIGVLTKDTTIQKRMSTLLSVSYTISDEFNKVLDFKKYINWNQVEQIGKKYKVMSKINEILREITGETLEIDNIEVSTTLNQNSLVINNEIIGIKEYNGERVITVWDIAKVHNRVVGEINKIFNRNKDKFFINEDYFILNKEDFSERFKTIQTFIPNNVKEIILITESGYLMLVKSFNDELSWGIQRELVKNYFKVKNESKSVYKLPTTYAEALRELAETVEQRDRLEKENLEMKPKVEFAATFLETAEKEITIGQFAKLTESKIGLGRNKMFALLRSMGILDKENIPYQKYMQYFTVIETSKGGKDCLVTLVKVKGQEYLLNRLIKEFE